MKRRWSAKNCAQHGAAIRSEQLSAAEKTTHCLHPAAQFPGSIPPIPGCTPTPTLRHSAKKEWQASLEVHGTCWHVVGASIMLAYRIRVQNRQNGVGKGDNVLRCCPASRVVNCKWLKTQTTSLPPQIRR